MADNVNHPAHYEASTSIECIETMEVMFGHKAVYYFCMCNAFKYIWRFKHKNGLEDLDKANWYLQRAIEIDNNYQVTDYGEDELRDRLIQLRDQKEDEWRG